MAFTRKFLAALGIEPDKIDEIITAHTEVTDALKAERDRYKADAEKLPGVQKELDALKGGDGDKGGSDELEELRKQLKQVKAEYEAKEVERKTREAYSALLREVGIPEKRVAAVLRASDLSGVKLGDDGKITDAEERKKAIAAEWSDFIPTEAERGVNTANPPSNTGGGKKSREEILAIKDTQARQKAIAENHELFGF